MAEYAPVRRPSGRPAGEHGTRLRLSITLTPDVIEYIDTHGISRADVIEQLFRDSAGFQKFLKEKTSAKTPRK